MNFNRILTTFIIVAAAAVLMPAVSNAQLTARANHDHITVGLFYHGSEVSVRGISDPGTDIVVKIEGAEGEMSLKKKDKVGGMLWMNVGDEEFKDVPTVYFMRSSKDLDAMLTPEELNKYVIGYSALENHAEIEPVENQTEKDRLFDEFVKLQEKGKLFKVDSGDIELSEKDGLQSYYTVFDWPYQAKPGDYEVTVYAVKDGKVTETATAAVDVKQIGVVESLSKMSRNNGALYGALSVIIALAAGFGVGLVFKGGGAH